MKARDVLAPAAALDLVQIWRYIKKNANLGVKGHRRRVKGTA